MDLQLFNLLFKAYLLISEMPVFLNQTGICKNSFYSIILGRVGSGYTFIVSVINNQQEPDVYLKSTHHFLL